MLVESTIAPPFRAVSSIVLNATFRRPLATEPFAGVLETPFGCLEGQLSGT